MPKSPNAEREEKTLAYWREKKIFEKTLEKTAKGKEFVFYEGPPTANGRPGIHHLEARAFKDAIPRYKTMRGFFVRRKGGWDTHGLPVELAVEKELGLKSKKEIEQYGIAAFNEKCKESVWQFVHEWEDFTDRMGYWVDLKHPYITYKPEYIESVWNIVKTVDHERLLYKDYKVVPWCPRCGTALSSHELAQGYEDVKDLSVYVKFKVLGGAPAIANVAGGQGGVYFLAWTTTPWTLPGNVALAIGEKMDYVAGRFEGSGDVLIMAKERSEAVAKASSKDGAPAGFQILSEFKGKDLIGASYEPLYPFMGSIAGPEKDKLADAFKVYAADFVTTADGTGIVHTAVMYGQDDFELGTKVGLPKHHLVGEDGTFKPEAGFLAGKFVKDEATDVEIIKDLAGRGLLFAKEKYQHSYPFCWRCHTPLIYYARDSWYIKMSALRQKLIKENQPIHWEPEHIKDGRFGEWLREVKDWAVSRERYWGTPLPIWVCEHSNGGCGERRVAGSIAEISKKPRNTYWAMRHGQADNNTRNILDSEARDKAMPSRLTAIGRDQAISAAYDLKKIKPDLVYVSPLERTKETAAIIKEKLGLEDGQVISDDRIREMDMGEWNGKDIRFFYEQCRFEERFTKGPKGGETYADIKKRMGEFLYDLESKHEGKKVLIISHETPIFLLMAAAQGLDRAESLAMRGGKDYIDNAEVRQVPFSILPHNPEFELDLHRPYIDEVRLPCACGKEMKRVREVMDVWFDSGAMPFAEDHWPFKQRSEIRDERLEIRDERSEIREERSEKREQKLRYPADFISEAIDQTRGWFYTLHAIGVLMGKGKAYKNVVCLGHILDAKGQKMSKHIGNVLNPFEMMDKYGADALRFWMYSVNQPGESKDFDEKTVDEIVKKVFNLAANVLSFYKLYERAEIRDERLDIRDERLEIRDERLENVLDRWIMARLDELVGTVTDGLDSYIFLEPTRAIREFVADLSQWYLRRSRDRFKGDDLADKEAALATTKEVLLTLAKVMAPFAPFFAEHLYKEAGGPLESVHLEKWPAAKKADKELIKAMGQARSIASKALEARMAAKINVRQPLSSLKIGLKLSDELAAVLREEINVKSVAVDAKLEGEIALDTDITPALKEEGDFRELVRRIQDARKEKGMTILDVARLTLASGELPLAQKYEQQLKKATNIGEIKQGEAFSVDKA
ncbi:MAG: class I tRNA ligase family protein [Patescibacteria group bacterium]|nr:class I tRNA ligase family protein [Patescibacteria group bacterium]